jgi:diguanylate cyclase (GGDEF)-like protein/PAS domain S-box-containing protein
MFASQPTARAAFLTDAAGHITSWNDGCERLFGMQAQDIIGKPIASLLSPDGARDCMERWPQLPQQAEALELGILRPGEHTSGANLTLIPQYDRRGAFTGCIAAFTTELDEGQVPESVLVGRAPLSAIVRVFAGTFYVINEAGRLVLWNERLEQVSGKTPQELSNSAVLDMFDLLDRRIMQEKIRQVFEQDQEVLVDATYVDKSGKRTPFLLGGARIRCDDKFYLCGMGLDISERIENEKQLRVRERALHAAHNGIVITRSNGKDHPIEYVNPAFEVISGYRSDEVIGLDPRFMAAPGLDLAERAQLREALSLRRAAHVTFRNLRKNGELFWNDLAITPVVDDKGEVTHFIGILTDVTAVKQRTADLEHEVNHDALTGLANRTLLWDRLEQALHMAQRNKSLVATVLVDLNNFKQINDSMGHEAGDEVLKVVARRLLASVRDSDTVARLSGDEFVLVLVNQPSLRYTSRMLERLRQSMSKPVVFDNTEISVGASMGVSIYPHDGNTAFDLVRAADVAMYHAKATRKSDVHFFSADMKSSTDAKRALEEDMQAALQKNEMFLMFQPRICLSSGRIKGLEALLRWRHPRSGMLLPSDFLAEAEENGMIVPIGKVVLELACSFSRHLGAIGFADVKVAVNASYREYSQQDYVRQLADTLSRFGLAPACLELELREEVLMRNPNLGREVASQMRELGIPLSVDAFGDGLSDLRYLRQLKVNYLKLARVAVQEIDGGNGSMAKTLIDIGHNLKLAVVAECVETRAQLDFLKANGCDQMQGSYFSEPLSEQAVEQFLCNVER